jgi:hypothetical protein
VKRVCWRNHFALKFFQSKSSLVRNYFFKQVLELGHFKGLSIKARPVKKHKLTFLQFKVATNFCLIILAGTAPPTFLWRLSDFLLPITLWV